MVQCVTALVETHFDDACLALAHALAIGVLPPPVHLVTVFSGADPRLAADPVRDVRLSEGRKFCDAFGLTLQPLGFEDRPVTSVTRDCGLAHQIAQRLLEVFGRSKPVLVLSPRPYGWRLHTHHLAVRYATSSAVASRSDAVLALYDDIPYSRIPVWSALFCNAARYVPFLLTLSEADLRNKSRVMGLFESQMKRRPSYYDAVQQHAPGGPPGPSETVWVPRGLAASQGCPSGGDAEDLARVLRSAVSPVPVGPGHWRCDYHRGGTQLLRVPNLLRAKRHPAWETAR